MSKKKPITYSEWLKNNAKDHFFLFYANNSKSPRNLIPVGTTRKKAMSEVRKIIEFEQLLAIRNIWIGDWDEYTGHTSYIPTIFIRQGGTIEIRETGMPSYIRISRLTFPTQKMCTEFIKRFKAKIKRALL